MSRKFNGTVTDYLEAATAAGSAVPLTIACWFNPDTAVPVNDQVLVSLIGSGTGDGFRLLIEGSSGPQGHLRAAAIQGASSGPATTANPVQAGKWQHACARFKGTTDRSVFLGGTADKGDNAALIVPAGVNTSSIGRDVSRGHYFAGSIGGYVAVWATALDDGDVDSLAGGAHPLQVRPDDLLGAYWPLNGRSPEPDVVEEVGGLGLTVNGTTIQAAPPTMIGRTIVAPQL